MVTGVGMVSMLVWLAGKYGNWGGKYVKVVVQE